MLQSNRVAPKCSQMDFRKVKLGTSTGSSPQNLTLTPKITITYPTAILKMDLVVPKKSTQKHPKTVTRSCPQVPRTQIRKCPRQRPWTIRHNHQRMQAKFKMTKGQLQHPPGRPTIPENLHFRPDNGSPRMGKVAIVRDMAAVTYVKTAAN